MSWSDTTPTNKSRRHEILFVGAVSLKDIYDSCLGTLWFLSGYLVYFFLGTALSKDVGGCVYSVVNCNRNCYSLFFLGTFFGGGGYFLIKDIVGCVYFISIAIAIIVYGSFWVPLCLSILSFYFLGTLLIEEIVGCVYSIWAGDDW